MLNGFEVDTTQMIGVGMVGEFEYHLKNAEMIVTRNLFIPPSRLKRCVGILRNATLPRAIWTD
jgi:hypothetical protein